MLFFKDFKVIALHPSPHHNYMGNKGGKQKHILDKQVSLVIIQSTRPWTNINGHN